MSAKRNGGKQYFVFSVGEGLFFFLIATFIIVRFVKNRHDEEADVPERGRPEQADGILGDDQECHLYTIGQ